MRSILYLTNKVDITYNMQISDKPTSSLKIDYLIVSQLIIVIVWELVAKK